MTSLRKLSCSVRRTTTSPGFLIILMLLGTHQCTPLIVNTARIRRETALFGGSKIERVGPSADDTPFVPFEVFEPEENLSIPTNSLVELLSPSPSVDVNQMGPTALAYLGDVVFELFVRSRKLWPSRRTDDLQQQVVALVNAEHQSRLLAALLETFQLMPAELQILSRGRNSSTSKANNRKNPKAYQDSTAVEALIGYLYITDKARLQVLLNWMAVYLEKV